MSDSPELPPMVSAILPTYNRRSFLPAAIDAFRRQDYPHRELIVVDDGEDNISDLIPSDPLVRYIRLGQRHSIGAKRNLACTEARGEIVVHWDDDDWAATWRIRYQTEQLIAASAKICGLDRIYYYQPATAMAWEYRYPRSSRPWVGGNSLCYRRSFWKAHPFPDVDVGEDARFVWQAKQDEVLRLTDSRFLVAFIHDTNVSPKRTSTTYWSPQRPEFIESVMNAQAPRLPTDESAAEDLSTMTIALKTDLDLPEFAAYREGQALPHMRRWESPWALFAARLSDGMSVLDCTINPAGFGQRLRQLYGNVSYTHWNPVSGGEFVPPHGHPENTFDRVFCVNTLEHLLEDQREALVAILSRVLKSGGLLVLTGDFYFESFWVRPEVVRSGLVRADRTEVFNGFNKVTARDWARLASPHGLVPLTSPGDDPREDDKRLFRNNMPFPHAAIGGVLRKNGPDPAQRRARILLSLLTWNTRQASIDSVNAYVREAEMLNRLGYEAVLCVCDNGSTDGTAQALRDMDTRIRVPHRFLLNDCNRGNSVGRNQIIGYAREAGADYVLFMDGDIEVVPFSSFAMLRYMEMHGRAVGCIGASSSGQSPIRARTTKYFYSIEDKTVHPTDVVSWTQYGMYRREVFDDQIVFDESGPFGGPGWGYEDNDLAFQMQAKGYRNDYFSGMIYLHRNARSSVSNLRRSGFDANQLCQARKQYLIAKWDSHPLISRGPLEVIRQMHITL